MPVVLTSVLLSFLMCDGKNKDKEYLAEKKLLQNAYCAVAVDKAYQTEPIRQYGENELRQKIERLEKKTLMLQRLVIKLLKEQRQLKEKLRLGRHKFSFNSRTAPLRDLRLERMPTSRKAPQAQGYKKFLKRFEDGGQRYFFKWSEPRPDFQQKTYRYRLEPRSKSYEHHYF